MLFRAPTQLIAPIALIASLSTFADWQNPNYQVDGTGLPILNSNPNAVGVAYMDFNGGTVFGQARGPYGGDYTFDATEQQEIYNAWLDVSHHFAMFDINVTTVAPNKFVTPTAHVLITPDMSGGAANVGFFGNTSSVARGANNENNARTRTTGITHEFGHIMGLYHQSDYDSQGNLTANYRSTDQWNVAPIMGVDFAGKYSSWQDGFTGSNMTPQDDIDKMSDVIISTYNSFTGNSYAGDGFRPDEHSNVFGNATPFPQSIDGIDSYPLGKPLYEISAYETGIIERYSDVDMFSLDWGGGSLSITSEAVENLAANPQYASSVGMVLTLYDYQGQVIAQDIASNPADVINTVSSPLLLPGVYFISVESNGEYEDLGAYTLKMEGLAPRIPVPGDLDYDGDVDGVDIVRFFSTYTGENNGPPSYPRADFDTDGDVDGSDISKAFVAYTGSLTPANVPEPASLAMLSVFSLMLARRRTL